MRPFILAVLFLTMLFSPSTRAEYAAKDGDTVVFLGDSITAARQYSKIIENYTLLRYPKNKVRFINAGRGGETAHGSLARLDKDVFAQGATVLTVAYGINDISWGVTGDEAHKKLYLDAISEIIDRCKSHGVKVFICSAAITDVAPDKAETGFLQTMCDEGLALAKSKGAQTIDVQRSMRVVQRRILGTNTVQSDKPMQDKMHLPDGVHLNELGQMAMAHAILQGLGAPAEVSAVEIDADQAKVLKVEFCRVTSLKTSPKGLTFIRTDERLPLNLNPLWLLQDSYVGISEGLNRYELRIANLPAGNYELSAEGRVLGNWSALSFAEGLNIASVTTNGWEAGGLWDAQAQTLKVITDLRDDLASTRRHLGETLNAHPNLASFEKKSKALEKNLIQLQRELAQPVALHFEVRRIEALPK